MNRNVWLLFCCQAMMNAVMSGQAVMAALIGEALTTNRALTTLPLAIQMLSVMAGSIPAGIVFGRLGRRPGFWMGTGMSLVGSVIYAFGVWRGDFVIYCLGAIPTGMGFGIAQHLRFAAAEVAAPNAKTRAIALVMSGGVLAALVGPEIVKRTHALIPLHVFLATYFAMAVLPLIAAILLLFVEVPPAPPRIGAPVRIGAILARPTFLTAVVAGIVGYGTMQLVMASTPVQMKLCGFGVDASADVIRAHAVAMYLPGFITGRLIQRFGAHGIICAGALLAAGCAAVNLGFDPWFSTFTVALVLLGIGWNFMFVGGTTLLISAHDPHERVRVQATNDFIVFGSVALTILASGAIETGWGWDTLNLAVLPPAVIASGLVIWHWATRARVAAVAAE
ncbi:MAG: MFS transporter [Rhodospirillales bacterium]|jgi:MFS family permease|nr:MFS transporter [Rhodospirillales bacterium]